MARKTQNSKRTPNTSPTNPSRKIESLEADRVSAAGEALRTNQGLPVGDDQNSLRAGTRGPSLLEDFILREKITHFDHERVPERVVHARGEAAHGYFQVYQSMARYTKAGFLQDPAAKTPVFVRFSTVAGSRGSADTVRDVRGFAVKFYTDEGNFDLVGNNIPVFFIQDAIKFPDFVHAVKPEPHHEMPQAASAHDTFWDFVSLVPETTHMLMWVMSDRAIPRSLRMMEGFGVNTFRLVDAKGAAHFVKFHWKPVLGKHSLVWDEAQKIAGKDPDFHRRDLWEAIESGAYPEFELGVQLVRDGDEGKFDFDILDATKLIPEEIVPVQRIGKMVLNRNPDNFFAETEQVAFHPGHVVPGIDFSNDPLLQGRLFSYTDTQLTRLGGPNFHEIPINRAICPFANNQRDGLHRQAVNVGRTSYEPNSLSGGWPKETRPQDGGFASYPEAMEGRKIRTRSETFGDHFSQATLFWNSQSDPEKDHIVAAFQFELSKVETPAIRARMISSLENVHPDLARRVAPALGLSVNGAKATSKESAAKNARQTSPALSLLSGNPDTIASRKIAILAADGADLGAVAAIKHALEAAGAQAKILAPHLGTITTGAASATVDFRIVTMPSVLFDAVYVPGGDGSTTMLAADDDVLEFLRDAFKHGKAIAATGSGQALLDRAGVLAGARAGVVIGTSKTSAADVAREFISAVAQHRHWARIPRPLAARS